MTRIIFCGAGPTAHILAQIQHQLNVSAHAAHRAALFNQPAEGIAPFLKSGLDLEDIESKVKLIALAAWSCHPSNKPYSPVFRTALEPLMRSNPETQFSSNPSALQAARGALAPLLFISQFK